MIKTSEWVSLGHPDKVADYISCYLLDRYLELDPRTRFAVEVQIKDDFVTLGGEVTSEAFFTPKDIAKFVRNAVAEIGYTREYQASWGSRNTICADTITVTNHIGMQSPDIAQGVDADGWGDQGIFWGMAVNNPETDFMPEDWFLAKKIGLMLYSAGVTGVDIKTQVTMQDGKPQEIVVAAPLRPQDSEDHIRETVKNCCGDYNCYKLIVNGTGRFVTHGPVGDCGTTGRKLAVDFYGGNCRIGGGSPWTKDGTKADLALNLMARLCALEECQRTGLPEVHCAISCRIGSPEVLITLFGNHMNELKSYRKELLPSAVIRHLRLLEPRFCDMCKNGLFCVF